MTCAKGTWGRNNAQRFLLKQREIGARRCRFQFGAVTLVGAQHHFHRRVESSHAASMSGQCGVRVEALFGKPVEKSEAFRYAHIAGRAASLEYLLKFLSQFARVAAPMTVPERVPTPRLIEIQTLPQIIEQNRRASGEGATGKASVDQNALAERVNRANEHRLDIVGLASVIGGRAQQRAHALFELGGGFFGEGRQKNLFGRHAVNGDQIDAAPQQNSRFARTRPRRKIKRPIEM